MKKQISTLLITLSFPSLLLCSGCLDKKNIETKTTELASNATEKETTETKDDKTTTEEIKMNKKITLDSGLAYEILTPAAEDAAQPSKGSMVKVHYTGWLNDGNDTPGKKFDSSVDRGQPFVFKIGVGYVIKGWDEGVLSMHVGEKRRLFIPSKLGYGPRGAGADIPPHADLIFDVELLAV
jgi:FKBP-type peptidyl-prolyl cis-trans isomerase